MDVSGPPADGTFRRPKLVRADGRPLGGALGTVYSAISHAPRGLQTPLQRAARRVLASRLPALRAEYADGRLFSFPARDTMHSPVFVFGEYEPAESAMIRRLLRDGDLAVDVGANIGWFSLLMATCVGDRGSVIAIEPTPPIRRYLLENVSANPSLSIRVIAVAVGAIMGVAEIHLFREMPHGHASLSDLGRSDDVTFDVPVDRLDHLIKREDKPPALIKVDVEGSELDVLRGAEDLLSLPTPPIWMLEVNHQTSASFGYRPPALLELLRSYNGYRTFRLAEGKLIAETSPSTAPHGTTWFCVPSGHDERLTGAV